MKDKPETVLCTTDGTNYYVCTAEEACTSGTTYKYTESTIKNWVTQFDLLCESTMFLKVIYYFFFGGFFVGATILAPLADYFGRKGILIFSSLLLVLVYLKTVFTTDAITCAVVLCCSGLLVGVFYCVGITYLTELATQESAMIYTIMFHMAFPISGTIVAVLLRLSYNWTVVTTIFALVPLILVLYMTSMAESPRFLASKGLYKDARYAANMICESNTGKKKHWDFNYEHATYMQEYAKFAEEREGKSFQHGYFLSYASSRYYLFAFFILLFTSGFAFSGLALAEKKLFNNVFLNTLVLQAIEATLLFITGFFVQVFGHKRTIGYSLIATAGLGILCTLAYWINDSLFGIVGYINKLTATVAFVSSIAFSAELCPARVRATGFGMSVGAAVLGLMCGGFVLEFYDKLHILFGIVAACGVLVMPCLKEPAMYSTNDDIFEINEMRKNNYKEDTQKKRPSSIAPPAMLMTEQKLNAPLKSGLDLVPAAEPVPVLDEASPVLYSIEGSRIVKDRQEQIGFDLLQLAMDGTIRHEGKDEIGEYVLTGKICKGNAVTIVKKYREGKEIRFEGTRTRENVGGSWSDENEKGDFNFAFKLRPWKGTVGGKGQQITVEWFMEQTGRRIYGLAIQDELAIFISGIVHESGTVSLTIAGENDMRQHIEGKMEGNKIHGPEISLKLSKDL